MNNRQILGALCVLALSLLPALPLCAQSSRVLPFLSTPTDARAAAMGNATLLKTDRNYLYTNPASIFNDDIRLTVTATGLTHMMPKDDYVKGNLMLGSVTAGYRFLDRHVVYAGFRYQGGLQIKGGISEQWGTNKRFTSPFDFAVDLGYAFRITDALAAYATGSFIQSYTGRAAYAGAFSVGANYLLTFSEATDLNLAARVADLGAPIYYSKKDAYAMPSNAQLTADFGHAFSDDHKVRAAVGAKYFFLPAKAQVFQTNLGAEYTLYNLASLRAGFQYGTKDTSLWSAGVGFAYRGAKLDLGYLGALNQFAANKLMLTLSFDY